MEIDKLKKTMALLAMGCATVLFGGVLDNAWIKCTTNKNPLEYKPGEEMVFTLSPQGIEGVVPEGEYFLNGLSFFSFSLSAVINFSTSLRMDNFCLSISLL